MDHEGHWRVGGLWSAVSAWKLELTCALDGTRVDILFARVAVVGACMGLGTEVSEHACEKVTISPRSRKRSLTSKSTADRKGQQHRKKHKASARHLAKRGAPPFRSLLIQAAVAIQGGTASGGALV